MLIPWFATIDFVGEEGGAVLSVDCWAAGSETSVIKASLRSPGAFCKAPSRLRQGSMVSAVVVGGKEDGDPARLYPQGVSLSVSYFSHLTSEFNS